ncbi:MAG: hypothetical protein ACLGH0_15005 [Thermoanaerobaculia bacterium]
MRRLGIAFALALAATGAYAHDHGHFSRMEDCDGRHIQFDGEPSFTESQTIEAGSLRSLKASVEHAPLSVEGGNASGYTIVVCKAAAVQSDLSAIRVSLEDGELRATGPSGQGDRWQVSYHIRAPRNANLDLETENGPVSIRDVDGTVVARAANGPLALQNLRGTIEATTTNGPISISGGGGTMRVRATNGPLSVHLSGNAWEGGSLDASTKNGPLTVKLPRNYGSGVVVETSGHSPIQCRAAGCGRVRSMGDDDYDEPRTIELGSGPAMVRISTTNGPVTIMDE